MWCCYHNSYFLGNTIMNTNSISKDESVISAQTALCLASITMVGIDGEFKEEELEKLRTLIHTDESAFLKAFSFYNDRPLDVCIKTVSATLNNEQKRITYQVLYDLAQVDRDFAVSEQDLLNQYAAEFKLDKGFTSSIKSTPSHKYNLAAFG